MRYERTEIYTVLCHTNYYGNGALKICSQARYLFLVLMDGHIEQVKFGAKRVPLFTSLAFFTFLKTQTCDVHFRDLWKMFWVRSIEPIWIIRNTHSIDFQTFCFISLESRMAHTDKTTSKGKGKVTKQIYHGDKSRGKNPKNGNTDGVTF